MNSFTLFLVSIALFSGAAFSQTELTMKKFRFQKHANQSFERLVLEFSGPSMKEDVEMKVSQTGHEKDVSLTIRNVQLVGAVPESSINESLQKSRKWMGPLSFNTDMPKNGFSIRTLLNDPDCQMDAFWLSSPTRLVVDVFPKNAPRAASREMMETKRNFASHAKPKMSPHKMGAASQKSGESIFCFPADAKMSGAIAFSPWTGSSSVPLAVKNPASAGEDLKDGIVCYPAQSRVHPQVSFSNNEVTTPQPLAAVPPMPAAEGVSEASAAPQHPRSIANEAEQKPVFDPRPNPNNVPPSLGANFDKAKKGADPASLLPPFR